MTDPIADMLNRIQNAQAVKKETVEVPFSRMRFEVAKILERTGFLKKVELKTKRTKKTLEIALKPRGIQGVKRVSKPGQRRYTSVSKISSATRNYGISILSTPKGLMTAGEAKKQNVGGELVCQVW